MLKQNYYKGSNKKREEGRQEATCVVTDNEQSYKAKRLNPNTGDGLKGFKEQGSRFPKRNATSPKPPPFSPVRQFHNNQLQCASPSRLPPALPPTPSKFPILPISTSPSQGNLKQANPIQQPPIAQPQPPLSPQLPQQPPLVPSNPGPRSAKNPNASTFEAPLSQQSCPNDDDRFKRMKEKENIQMDGGENSDKKKRDVITDWIQQVLTKGVDGLKKEYQECPNVGTINEAKVFFNNPTRNRYIDIPCCDATRIKLPDDPNFYIHANMVSSNQNRRYICAQAPLNSTVEEFWKMIVYSGVEFIIMLCEFVENNKPKSAEYFPPKVGQSMKIGKFCNVTNVVSENIDKTLTMTTLLVTKQYNEEVSLIVSHIQWHNWPDHGVPDNFISPLLLLNAFKRCTKPIAVHCSAGVGRTGTLVLILIVLESLRLPEFSGVRPLFMKLREDRFRSIQTELQYLYVHRCVLEYLLHKKYRFDREAYAKFVKDYKAAEQTCCTLP